jgi:hypothetical protein
MMTMVMGRVPGTIGPRRRHPSAGSRSPTRNLHQRVSATIARRGTLRVHVGRLPSENAFRHGFGRYGCRRLNSELSVAICGPRGPHVVVGPWTAGRYRSLIGTESPCRLSPTFPLWPRWHSGVTWA